MDLITHLPMSDTGFDAIATFVDRFSKVTYFVPVHGTIDASEFASVFFRTVVCKHGMPDRVVSDRDRRFISSFWQALLGLLQCKVSLSSSYHPQTDGQSERMHRTLEQVLRCFVSPRQNDWDYWLPYAEFAINSTKSASTKYSPFFVLFGFEPMLPVQ